MLQSNGNSNDMVSKPRDIPVMGKTAFIRAEMEKFGYRPQTQTRAELKAELEAQGFDFSNAIVERDGHLWDFTGIMIASALDNGLYPFPVWPKVTQTHRLMHALKKYAKQVV